MSLFLKICLIIGIIIVMFLFAVLVYAVFVSFYQWATYDMPWDRFEKIDKL